MAQKVNIVLVDDLDQSDAAETVLFGLDGTAYEIDLSEKNAAGLRDALAPYLAHARKAASGGRRGRRTAAKSAPASVSARDIREWARANGYEVPDRGRVAAEVRQAYEAAH